MIQNDLSSMNRLWKGYHFEMYIQNLLSSRGVSFYGNPSIFSLWKKYTATGYDLQVKVKEGYWIKVECKFVLKRVYHSWFVRDWLSRKASIIVSNDPWKLSYADRKELQRRGIKLLTPTQAYLLYHLLN